MFGILIMSCFLTQVGLNDAPSGASIISSLPARFVGPAGPDGTRVGDIAVYNKDPKIFYIASSNGGVLKTINGGNKCTFVFDKQGSANIGVVTISQNNPDLVWVGTGDKWQRNSCGDGDGIYKSANGGKTWQHMGLEKCKSFSKIAIDPTNDNVVFAAGLDSAWGYSPNRGIFKTKDGGKTWRKVLYHDEKSAGTDVVIDPKNPKNMLAALWDHVHRPYGFFESGPGSAIYRSTDAGETWHKVTKGLPQVNFGRVALAYFPKNPKEVVAAVEDPVGSSIYRSHNGGETWEMRPAVLVDDKGKPLSEQDRIAQWQRPYYNHLIVYSSDDVNTYYYSSTSHPTHDDGKTFTGGPVGDSHCLWVNPLNSKHVISGSDGGVDQVWNTDLPNGTADNWMSPYLPIAQVYGIGYDMRRLYNVMCNLQDGTSWSCPTQLGKGYVSDNNSMKLGGDEAGCTIADPNDWTTVYTQGRGTFLKRVDLNTGEDKMIGIVAYPPRYAGDDEYPEYQKMHPKIRAGWNAGFQISPWNSKTLYFGANFLYKSIDRGDHWQVISPELTHNVEEWQKPDGMVYRNIDDPTCKSYQSITTISESPVKQGAIWVGTDCGYVQLTQDGGKTWANVTANIHGIPEYCWVSKIEASHFVEGRAYVTFDNHRNNDNATYIFMTDDFGKTWTKITGNMPANHPCYVIREGRKNPDLLYVGTEFNLFISLDRGKSWDKYQDFQGGYFPTVRVSDLQIHPRELDLIIGAHGRGIWIVPARALEEMTHENRAKDVYFTQPGNIYLFPKQKVEEQFKLYSRNTQPGTRFSYYLKKEITGGATIQITDPSGANIIVGSKNPIKGPSKAGLNSIPWMNTERDRIKQPGDYRVILTMDGKEYTQTLHVEDATNEILAGLKAKYPKLQEEIANDRN